MKTVDRNTFIEENMGLVGTIVNKHLFRISGRSDIDKEDLRNIGAIGLIKACDRFDESFGTKFSTYATHMIEGEIRRYFRDSLETVKFTRQSKIDHYAIASANLLNEKVELIADTLEISMVRVKNALDYYRCRVMDSLDREVFDEGGAPVTLADGIGTEVDFDSELEVQMFLDKLDKRTRKVVKLRLQGLTQAEIGKIMGVSQVQVGRVLSKVQDIYKGGNKVEGSKEVAKTKESIEVAKKLAIKTDLNPSQVSKQSGVSYGTARKYIEEYRKVKENKSPDFTLAKRLAEETELNPNQISKRSGVAYATARNYVQQYRVIEEEKQEIAIEEVAPITMEKHRLDIPEEVINKPKAEPSDGFMTMTFKLTTESATSELEEIIKAMSTLGFENLNITIQSNQVAQKIEI